MPNYTNSLAYPFGTRGTRSRLPVAWRCIVRPAVQTSLCRLVERWCIAAAAPALLVPVRVVVVVVVVVVAGFVAVAGWNVVVGFADAAAVVKSVVVVAAVGPVTGSLV